jgi:hypothetical protein
MQINYPRLLADLHHLATFGQVGHGVHRLSFSLEDGEVRQRAESKPVLSPSAVLRINSVEGHERRDPLQ